MPGIERAVPSMPLRCAKRPTRDRRRAEGGPPSRARGRRAVGAFEWHDRRGTLRSQIARGTSEVAELMLRAEGWLGIPHTPQHACFLPSNARDAQRGRHAGLLRACHDRHRRADPRGGKPLRASGRGCTRPRVRRRPASRQARRPGAVHEALADDATTIGPRRARPRKDCAASLRLPKVSPCSFEQRLGASGEATQQWYATTTDFDYVLAAGLGRAGLAGESSGHAFKMQHQSQTAPPARHPGETPRAARRPLRRRTVRLRRAASANHRPSPVNTEEGRWRREGVTGARRTRCRAGVGGALTAAPKCRSRRTPHSRRRTARTEGPPRARAGS